MGNYLPIFTAAFPKDLNVDLIDCSAVVRRGYTLSGEWRITAINEFEDMLKWSWPIWGCYSATFLEELTVNTTNTGAQAKKVIRYGTMLLTTVPLRVVLLV